MNEKTEISKILVVDFGSQFTQLIARRIRELGVYSEIVSHKKTNQLNNFPWREKKYRKTDLSSLVIRESGIARKGTPNDWQSC